MKGGGSIAAAADEGDAGGGIEGPPSPKATEVDKSLIGLQILRGVAATSVVFDHLFVQVGRWSGIDIAPAYLPTAMGVDIFFVISGFVMMHASGHMFGKPAAPRRFLLRRIIRIVPLYWMFTSLLVAVLLVTPGVFNTARLDWAHIAASYVFLPYAAPDGTFEPILSLGWTLNYEMMFYVVFAVSLAFPARVGRRLVFGGIAGMVVVGWLLQPAGSTFAFWARPVVLEFLYGAALSLAFAKLGSRSMPLLPWLAMAAACVALAITLTWFDASDGPGNTLSRSIEWGIAAAGIVALGTLFPPRIALPKLQNLGARIGDSSYALYLSHPFVLGAAGLVWRKAIGFALLPPIVGIALLLVVSLLAAWLIFRWFETPVLALLKHRLRPYI